MIRVRRRLELPLLLAAQSKLPPQPNDPIAASAEALCVQFRLRAQWPVVLASLDMGSLDGDLQLLIIFSALRLRAIGGDSFRAPAFRSSAGIQRLA